MMALQINNQLVEVQEIVVIRRDNDTAIQSRMPEVDRIVLARLPNIDWHLDIMPCIPQQAGEERRCHVIVQIESHENRRLIRATTCGESRPFGLAAIASIFAWSSA